MSNLMPAPLHESRRKPLAACMGAIFALAAPTVYANTFVLNCNDHGTGSLRAAVTAAAEGDTVDATGLTTSSPGCADSKITLTTGDIVTARNGLTIIGPGLTELNVTGKAGSFPNTTTQPYRIFTHNGDGTLTIQNLSMSNGYLNPAAGNAIGGCVYSASNVDLINVGVYACTAKTGSDRARGGGVYTKGAITLLNSTIQANTVNGGSGNGANGGGVYSLGSFYSTGSSILNNMATNTAGTYGYEGGAFIRGTVTSIRNSTIADNSAASNIGGLGLTNPVGSATIVNSTISGNSAKRIVGGLYTSQAIVNIYNSTIAFNTVVTRNTIYAGGWLASGPTGATAKLNSTLIANNSYGSPAVASDISGTLAATGANNLVRAPGISLPGDTIVNECPLLGPLRNNGGPTLTHALLGHSPAIDTGNNVYNVNGETYDQRGSPYARESGPPGGPAIADIGAYEVNRSDKIFDADFEGCS